MSQRIRLWSIFGVLAFGLLIPGFAFAQESPAPNVPSLYSAPVQAPAPSISLDEKPMTLEEIKELLGPQNVCGAECGWPLNPHCTFSCGDAARCVNHWCVWI